MKNLVLWGLIFGMFSAMAEREISQNLLNDLAEQIDNICGDTWCEGDFDWSHSNLKCDLKKQECTIDLTLYDEDRDETASPLMKKQRMNFIKEMKRLSQGKMDREGMVITYNKVCSIDNVKSKNDLVDGSMYSDYLYETVSMCVSKMETEFYQYADKAEITSRFKACSAVELLDYNIEDAIGNQVLDKKIFYNERNAWIDLLQYARKMVGKVEATEARLSYLNSWDSPTKEICQQGLNDIQLRYHVLGTAVSRKWSAEKIYVYSISTKRSNKRMKVLVKKTDL